MTAQALDRCVWPAGQRDEITAALAEAGRLGRPVTLQPLRLGYAEVGATLGVRLRPRLPALVRVADGNGLLAIVDCSGTDARVLAPDGSVVPHPLAAVAALLRAAHERTAQPAVDRLLARAQLPAERAAAVAAALIATSPGAGGVGEGWSVRPVPRSFAAALRQAGLMRRLTLTSLAYGAQLVLLVVAWWMVGARAVGGRQGGNLLAWLGVLTALIAVRLGSSWAAGRLAVDAGNLLRTRLMQGLFALDTEPMRAEGIGQLLGRVMETEAVEALALGGGLLAMAALFELATGIVVLALGAAGARQLAVLSIWLGVCVLLAARVWRSLRAWSALRLGLTHDLVERMVGHRTLVAQQPPELRHRDEDQALQAYARAGGAMDRDAAILTVVAPRGWLLAGLAAIAPALGAIGAGTGVGALATSLGGVLFVYGALRKLAQAFPVLGAAAVAWRQVAPLFAGADADQAVQAAVTPPAAPVAAAPVDGEALISARDLGFRYPGRRDPVLVGCSLEIRRGEHILLEGPSGGGKSTLGALLAGLRLPDAGVLALDGVDQHRVGIGRWRARVGAVPQFHENHVFSATFLFNVLLGRGWPPRAEDIAEAEAICRELDLGDLLARMPSGLGQMIGESGWQLSHGERSRLFIARALLQRLDARILDESFAALDPETLERALACVVRRPETLIVIAHP